MVKITVETREKVGTIYTMTNENGVQLSAIAHGARLYECLIPVDGIKRDIVVGYESLVDHQRTRYYGATIGPIAGRIAQSHFELEGKTYHTEPNEKGNTLHGGSHSFDTKEWAATPFQTEEEAGVAFSYETVDGEGGFPGNIKVTVTYALNEENAFRITYEATSDQATILNLTNHGYFNLTGEASQAIDEHYLMVDADYVAETQEDTTTTGEKIDVTKTVFDFTNEKQIGETFLDTPFILNHALEEDLRLVSPDRKVTLAVKTTEPGIVLYTTGAGEAGEVMKTGTLVHHGSIAIEAQGIPGTEKYPQFGSFIVSAATPYHAETVYHLTF